VGIFFWQIQQRFFCFDTISIALIGKKQRRGFFLPFLRGKKMMFPNKIKNIINWSGKNNSSF